MFAPPLINYMLKSLKNSVEKSTARAAFEEGQRTVLKSDSATN
jgi:hypothetical protein